MTPKYEVSTYKWASPKHHNQSGNFMKNKFWVRNKNVENVVK